MIKSTLATIIVFALTTAPAVAQSCPGDLNHDNRVVISEVITVVSAALDGCGQQTPTPKPTPTLGCPYTFTDAADLQTGPYCAYDGAFHSGDCRQNQGADWGSDGHAFAVAFKTTPVLGLIGVVTGPRSGRITGATTDGFNTIHDWTGTVALSQNNQKFIVTPSSPPFWIDEPACTVVHYEGNYVGLIGGPSNSSRAELWIAEPVGKPVFPPDIADLVRATLSDSAGDAEPVGGAASN